MTGTVKFYNKEKEFGFISDSSGTDYFFHISEWHSSVEPVKGGGVSFDTKKGKKGMMAINIKAE